MFQDFLLPLLLQAAEAPPVAGAPADAPAPNLFNGPSGMLFPMIIVVGIIYLVIIRPDSRKRKALEQELKSLKKGDMVATIGGILGKVWRAEGSEVELLIDKDEQIKVRFKRSAVSEILRAETTGAGSPAAAAKEPREGAKA